MNQAEFIIKNSGAPFGIHDIAEEAAKVNDNSALSRAAMKLSVALETFQEELDKIGFELG